MVGLCCFSFLFLVGVVQGETIPAPTGDPGPVVTAIADVAGRVDQVAAGVGTLVVVSETSVALSETAIAVAGVASTAAAEREDAAVVRATVAAAEGVVARGTDVAIAEVQVAGLHASTRLSWGMVVGVAALVALVTFVAVAGYLR